MSTNIRILVAGFNEFDRGNLCAQLAEFEYFTNEAKDQQEVIERSLLGCDVVIFGTYLPSRFENHSRDNNSDDTSVETARILRKTNASLGIIFYGFDNRSLGKVEELYLQGEGGVGFISYESNIKLGSVLPAIIVGNWVCVSNKLYETPFNQEIFLRGLPETPRQHVLFAVEQLGGLTDAEHNMLTCYTQTNLSIAKKLNVSLSTVETRLTLIYAKLGLDSIDRRLRTVLLDRALAMYAQRQKVTI
jgi:DNA-binding CsgD family transcriptional regulator